MKEEVIAHQFISTIKTMISVTGIFIFQIQPWSIFWANLFQNQLLLFLLLKEDIWFDHLFLNLTTPPI